MGIRTAVAASAIALGGAAIAASAGAGQAAAFTPVIAPEDGIYLGVDLDHNETVALQRSPLVGMLNGPLTTDGLFYVDEKSVYQGGVEIDGIRYQEDLDFAGVTGEAASTRSGTISLAVVDPAVFAGSRYVILQVLG
ncbi:hypothetical protein DFR70_103426 [Nocardia tenerifensis]|uniref:MspA protein n=1 Tax=Nocardia tenerifensis TaxID=228006 RepID=A0A318KT58_9NOCA|nr:hypothetical protein [Nocardia tenerifensis]PXX66677.1 hypothetical protein DFR70_103426 [Nocardia tenerifensis]